MSNQFNREDRYLVLKASDLKKALTLADVAALENIVSKVDAWRHGQDKHRLAAVVVEHDWPEYETVWAMLEARVMGKPAPVQEQTENRFVRELRDHAKRFPAAQLFLSWSVQRALKYLDGYTTPPSEQSACCAECGKKDSDGWALYCVECMDKIHALFDSAEKKLDAIIAQTTPTPSLKNHGDI